jgi:threonyl-tRNA synthetase
MCAEHTESDQIFKIRHSLAHLLAIEVLKFDPEAKLAIGPVIDNGFYYDIDFSEGKTPTEKDLKTFQKGIKKLTNKDLSFEKEIIDADAARKMFADNPYKMELIEELIANDAELSIYKTGDFVDLCSGPHIENVSEVPVDGFEITNTAGAYWRGDEKNKMLTRIYGVAFKSKEELEEYKTRMEEALSRDHRKLGKELGLFVFSPIVGKGLPLWTEKGATLRRVIERFIVDEEISRGYKHVCTPDIASLELYKKSGHYPYYKDSMYSPIQIDDEEYMLRPMTCPHHFELYLSEPRSYRELPMRLAELAKLYRYEKSGELSGLIRVRNFCLSDAHIICANSDQAQGEINKVLDLIDFVCEKMGLKMGEDYSYRLSLGNREDEKKYFKDDKAWDVAENALRETLQNRGSKFVEAEDEAAFYGPKIDIQMRNVNGKEDTAFTVQYDFVMPKRFDLVYTDKDGEKKETIVIHRSSVGAIERIIAFLIEKYAGNFPLWLSPVQVAIIPVAETHNEKATELASDLKKAGFRVEVDNSDDGFGKKVRKAKVDKVPYFVIIGDKEIEENNFTLESRDNGNLGALSADDLKNKLV